jgi:uncharacterized protein
VSAAGMLALQEIDDRLAALRSSAHRIEEGLAGSPELVAARARAAEREAERRALDDRLAAAGSEGAALRSRARAIDRQLYGGTVRNPHDLLTLQRELADVRKRQAAADDAELLLMEESEAAAEAAGAAASAVVAIEEARAAAAGGERSRLLGIQEEIRILEAERDAAAAALPPAELALYARLAARLHPAVARLRGDSCAGCRLPLAVREVRAARTGSELVQCSNCDRVVAG